MKFIVLTPPHPLKERYFEANVCESAQEWLSRRGARPLVKIQCRERIPLAMQNGHWKYFARKIPADYHESDEWQQAFHGTWWYGLWNILLTGHLCASEDEAKGHAFNRLGKGVYCIRGWRLL